MRGHLVFDVITSKIKYHIELKRKVSIIKGNSGTGKSELYRLISDYNTQLSNPSVDLGVTINTSHNIYSIGDYSIDNIIEQINSKHDSILIIDENYIGKSISRRLADCINKSNNYFILVHRGKFDAISVAYDSIYEIQLINGVNTLVQIYKPNLSAKSIENIPDLVIVEDSKSGLDLIRAIANGSDKVITAESKSKIMQKINENVNSHNMIVVVADGSAIGNHIDELVDAINNTNTCKIYLHLPESIEWVLLHSSLFKNDNDLCNILNDWVNHIQSEYKSGEEFFEKLLIIKTKDTYARYTKKYLKKCYTDSCCHLHSKCRLYVEAANKLDDYREIMISGIYKMS